MLYPHYDPTTRLRVLPERCVGPSSGPLRAPIRDRLGGYTVRRRLHMGAAIFVAIFVAIFLALISAFVLSGKQWRAAQDRARARRIAEYRMNARLLRLNI